MVENKYKMLEKLEKEKNLNSSSLSKNNLLIESDFKLFVKILIEIIFYLFLLIPRALGSFLFLFFNLNKSKHYFSNIINEPFKLILIFKEWFFEARYTAGLTIFLIFIFLIQFLVLNFYSNIDNFLYSFYDLLNGNFYSIFTSIFLHANFAHLFGNILFLVVFGRVVERHFGKYVILIFLFSALIANLVSGYFFYILGDSTKALGASGGIAGLIILAIMLEPLKFTNVFIIPLPLFIVGWFGILNDIFGFFNNFNSKVNHLAHLSGYFTLLLLLFFFNIKNRKKVLVGFLINLLMFFLIMGISVYLNFNLLKFLN